VSVKKITTSFPTYFSTYDAADIKSKKSVLLVATCPEKHCGPKIFYWIVNRDSIKSRKHKNCRNHNFRQKPCF